MAFDKTHVDKVFEQKSSLLDQKILEKYFEDKQLNEQTKVVVEEQWNCFESKLQNCPNLDQIFYKLYYTINNSENSFYKSRRLIIRISQIAAILIIGILIATSIYFPHENDKNLGDQTIEFISQTGFRNQFKLPDGTTGWLGYGSELKYHTDANDQRIVELNGLAFFDVAHRPQQPFIVMTPTKLNIEVLGTRFNVTSYLEDHSCEIVVEQGSVKLYMQNKNVGIMVPDERIVYNISNNNFVRSNVIVSDYVAWKDGKLILRDFSMQETCLKLSQFYNVDFELLTEKVDKHKIRLVLENETLDDALKLITMIAPIKFQIEERRILKDFSYSKKKIIIKNK